jgi:hypothetical protein
MIHYNGVDILNSEFFHITPEGVLQLKKGLCKGKSPADIKTIQDLSIASGFCLWIMKVKDKPKTEYFLAMSFLKDLTPKIKKLTVGIREELIELQKAEAKETEESTKIIGLKYGSKSVH